MILVGIITATPSPAAVPGAGIFTSPLLLSLTIWVPVFAALVIATIPNPRGRYDVLMKQIAFFTNLGLVFVLFIAYNQFQNFLSTAQYEEKVPWLPAIGAVYHLGVDGPGLAMLILSGLIGISSVLASWGVRERVRSYFALLLLVQACVNGAIDSRDMFVLILFWGAAAIPVALLVLGWGGPRREGAAWRLVAYWGFGTAALVVAAMTLYSATGGGSFDMDVLLRAPLSPRVQLAAGAALIIAAATRLPLFPFHGWAREIYAEAPVGVAVVVAGSASRLGGYLLLRGLVTGEPDAARLLSPLVAGLAAVTIVYAGLTVFRAVDLRRAAGHLAMVPGAITVLGFAALTPLAITGGVLSLFTGGLAAAVFVGVCATVAERAQSRSLQVLGGLAARMPKLTWLAVLASLGLLGVPLMATFVAEMMTFFGSFKTQPVGAFAVAAGLAVVAIGVAYLLHRVFFGSPNPDAPGVSDASLGETWFLGLLVGALLWVGIFPAGPKIPGTDLPLFDPGLMNNMVAGVSDIASPYTGSTP